MKLLVIKVFGQKSYFISETDHKLSNLTQSGNQDNHSISIARTPFCLSPKYSQICDLFLQPFFFLPHSVLSFQICQSAQCPNLEPMEVGACVTKSGEIGGQELDRLGQWAIQCPPLSSLSLVFCSYSSSILPSNP